MQARKQHFIPQSLLKGFESRREGKTVYVNVYQKGKPPFCTATQNVAAQRDFYSKPQSDGVPTLDETITKYETGLAERLVRLRGKGVSDHIDSVEAAELVVHLAVRGSYIRELFDFGLKSLLGETKTLLSDTESLRAWIGIDGPNVSNSVAEALNAGVDAFRKVLPAKIPYALIKRIVLANFREAFDDFSERFVPQLSTLLEALETVVPEMLQKSHAQVLSGSLAPEVRVAELTAFSWSLAEAPERNLILPDCVALATGQNGASFAPYFTNDFDTVEAIYLPLSSDRVLVGQRVAAGPPAIAAFNSFAAQCSVRFFVSSKTGPELKHLSETIGTQPFAQIRDTVSESLRESVHRAKPASPGPANAALSVAAGESASGPQWQTTISFQHWENEGSAQKIGSVVGSVIREVARWMPLSRLDSVIFADDYAGALSTLDRGFEAPPLTSVSEGYGKGVSMAPLVMREGVPKVAIILRGWIGRSIVASEQVKDSTALHVLTFMLARAGYFTLFEHALPNAIYAEGQDYLDKLKFSNMYDASSVYFAARYSAAIAEEMSTSYREVLVGALSYLRGVISKEKDAYLDHQQLDRLLIFVTDGVSKILEYAAKLIGHCDELDLPIDDDAKSLQKALREAGLQNWLDVYRRDLRSLFGKRGQWNDVADFIELNSHTERLLWQFGILLWKVPDGRVWIEVLRPIRSS